MSGVGPFVDVELLVQDWLSSQLPDLRVCSELPSDIEDLTLLRVTRSPGTNSDMGARPRVDIQAFSPTRAGMWNTIGRANDAIARIKGQIVNGIQVDCPYTITDPIPSWWSPTVQCGVAVYEIELRVISV